MQSTDFNRLYHDLTDNKYDFGTGSWAVENKKITMKMDEYGEYHPQPINNTVNFSQEEVEKLKQTCLSFSSKNEDDISAQLYRALPNIHYQRELGYYSHLYVGHVLEGNYRENGSSGGFGTWILVQLLKQGEIDGVIQVTKSSASDKLFEYGISTTVEEIISGAKTKYYPVEYSEAVRKVESQSGHYAIIGLPSYIMEIRLLMEQNPILKQRIRFTVGLICGHQKSARFADFLAWQCGILPGKLKSINFRKKTSDSPASNYNIEVVGEINGVERTISKPMSELVGRDWGQGLFKVRASDFTDDVMNETADITLGDAWLPKYDQDSQGNNVMIVRNPIIQNVISKGIESGVINVDEVDAETIFQSQKSHYQHTRTELGYRLYTQKKRQRWIPPKRVNPSNSFPWMRRMIQNQRQKICLKIPNLYVQAVQRQDLNAFLSDVKKISRTYTNLYRIRRIGGKVKRILRIN